MSIQTSPHLHYRGLQMYNCTVRSMFHYQGTLQIQIRHQNKKILQIFIYVKSTPSIHYIFIEARPKPSWIFLFFLMLNNQIVSLQVNRGVGIKNPKNPPLLDHLWVFSQNASKAPSFSMSVTNKIEIKPLKSPKTGILVSLFKTKLQQVEFFSFQYFYQWCR